MARKSSDWKRAVVVAGFLGCSLLVVAIGFGLWKACRQGKGSEKWIELFPDSGMQIKDMEYTEVQQGKQVWTLKAEQARYEKGHQSIYLKGVDLLYHWKGRPPIRLQSRMGRFFTESKNIDLWGGVRVTLPRKIQLATEKAHYVDRTKKVFSDTTLVVRGQGLHIRADRWGYDLQAAIGRLIGHVRASISSSRSLERLNTW